MTQFLLAKVLRGGVRSTYCRLACAALALLITATMVAPANAEDRAVILSINDVYRLHGADDGAAGGMPRVRALRAELEEAHPDLLFLHAGDFLSPSFLGRTYRGEQMIDLMNVMDGVARAASHDPHMFAAFGNHEFDDTHCSKPGPLPALVEASEFTWLASNLDFARCEPLAGLAGHDNIAASTIVESGGLQVGLYSVTLSRDKYAAIVDDPMSVSCTEVAHLRAAGADVVVALTHLSWQDDLALLGQAPDGTDIAASERACTDAPDLVIGGHDHTSLALPSRAPRLFKADADAVSAWVVEIARADDGELTISGNLVYLDENRPVDPLAERLADMWTARHDEQYCARDCISRDGDDLRACLALATGGACLAQQIARTDARIETEELRNRSDETGFGNWVADAVREAGNAEVGFINAGGIRLNYSLPAGTMITRRHLEEMFPFKNKLAVRDVPAGTLWAAMEVALARRGEGAWAHFSGMAVRVQVSDDGRRLSELVIRRADGSLLEVTPDTQETVSVASISFVLANGDRHGFDLCPDIDDIWACKDALEDAPHWPLEGDGADLSGFVRLQLLQIPDGDGLQLTTDGRLCDPTDSICLIDAWAG
jgi:5'-nucleotidase